MLYPVSYLFNCLIYRALPLLPVTSCPSVLYEEPVPQQDAAPWQEDGGLAPRSSQDCSGSVASAWRFFLSPHRLHTLDLGNRWARAQEPS